MTKKITALIQVDFDAPDDTDAWNMAQWIVTGGTLALGRNGGREILPNIVRVTANGKPVTFKPKRRTP